MDIVAKVYEKVKNRQNEKIHSNISQMQTAGRKQRSSMDNILIVSSIIEKRRQEEQNTYLMCADAVKCFEKLWLKDCLIEMKELGYSSNNIKILYEMYKKTDIKIETPFGEISNMEIKEVVKQGSTYGPIMCCTATSNVKDISDISATIYESFNVCLTVLWILDIKGLNMWFVCRKLSLYIFKVVFIFPFFLSNLYV